MNNPQYIFSMHKLSKIYPGGKQVIKDISLSFLPGAKIGVLSRDHKPDDELEKIRIQAAGGKIYRTQTFAKAAAHPGEKDLYVQGPLRVFPGRLSVSKTFGDIEAKRPRYGGNPNVIVCDPDIKVFKI